MLAFHLIILEPKHQTKKLVMLGKGTLSVIIEGTTERVSQLIIASEINLQQKFVRMNKNVFFEH